MSEAGHEPMPGPSLSLASDAECLISRKEDGHIYKVSGGVETEGSMATDAERWGQAGLSGPGAS